MRGIFGHGNADGAVPPLGSRDPWSPSDISAVYQSGEGARLSGDMVEYSILVAVHDTGSHGKAGRAAPSPWSRDVPPLRK